MEVAILLFDDFETLDVYGPVEIFGLVTELYAARFYSLHGGLINNKAGLSILTEKLEMVPENLGIFLIPGGIGTRKEVDNQPLLDKIIQISTSSTFVLTVCTGSALLAKTGLLDGKNATSNKRALDWVMSNGPKVTWNKKARWVVDGKYYTSSGVSAGMDMVLGFLSDRHGIEMARQLAYKMEYHWMEDKDNDNFYSP
ncbi:DJ-1/PfpI family protein [Flavihumibacter fluvii]|uniref:DJ-1/PfpI family protein n=1 Tax=Flavihumibacter fluvii TaxID=2838157 RepID=UPI001BDE7C22|nr:DJ-1/PfpI family protein [Flavihumibacter fluvii]ULQ53221.1 DJ-1/PfpI family protein [Flavihumibacter fluvii]